MLRVWGGGCIQAELQSLEVQVGKPDAGFSQISVRRHPTLILEPAASLCPIRLSISPDMTKIPDLTIPQHFKPYHVRLREYLKRRAKILNVDATVSSISLSTSRMREFWLRIIRLKLYTLSSLFHQSGDIRPFTQVNVFGEDHLALLNNVLYLPRKRTWCTPPMDRHR